MIEIGKYSRLKTVKKTDFGIYLDAGERETYSEILLPKKYVPKDLKIGEFIDAFIYKDSQNRPIATTQKPKILLNDFASLEVRDINKYGAFLDWGIDNQLLLPFREQPESLKAGEKVTVMMYLDRVSDRLVATSRLDKFLHKTLKPEDIELFNKGDSVKLLIYERTDIGFKAVIISDKIEHKYSGILYHSDVFQRIKPGDEIKGFIKTIRDDGKIDLTLRKTGLDEIAACREKILRTLKNTGGYLSLNDDSSPEDIKKLLEMSKKSFKKAIGMLYKDKLIIIEKHGIKLLNLS